MDATALQRISGESWSCCRNNARPRSYYVWQTSGLENTQMTGIFICQTLSVFLRHLSPCVSHPVSVDIQIGPAHFPPSKREIRCGENDAVHFEERKEETRAVAFLVMIRCINTSAVMNAVTTSVKELIDMGISICALVVVE